MPPVDTRAIARRLVRALRGSRSQPALSRRLGYRSNVVYMWESGRREPCASELFRIVAKTGGDPKRVWAGFRVDLDDVDLEAAEGIASLLGQLRGGARIVDVAQRCGASRYTTSRWLRGQTEPRLSELLSLVDALTLRLVDLLAALVPPSSLPMLIGPWKELEARRRVTFTHPWSQAILRQLETTEYKRLARHRDAWLAARLGITESETRTSLSALHEAGLVRFDGERFDTQPVAVDTSTASLDERRKARLHWADVGRAQIEADADGLFSWAVVALSRDDYARLRQMHVEYMKALRQLVDRSEPSEIVAVANVQLFPLGPTNAGPSAPSSGPSDRDDRGANHPRD